MANVDENITCPAGMSRALYQGLRKEYDRAVARYGMSVNNQARQVTINKNKKQRDDEKVALKEQLESWKNNGEIRELITSGNVSFAEAVGLLKQASKDWVNNHTDVMGMLQEIWDRLGGPSSSSSSGLNPMALDDPMVVDAVEVAVDSDDCIICMDACPDFVVMPCCFQGNIRACVSCFMELLVKKGNVTCPCCRSPFDVDLGRFKTLVRALPLPQPVVEMLLDTGRAKMFIPLVNILDYREVDIYDEDGPEDYDEPSDRPSYNEFHVELVCCNGSSLNKNPLWADLLIGDPLRPVKTQVPILKLSVAGDEVDTFVHQMCNGVWPQRSTHVRITCGDVPYPMHYYFNGFRRIVGKETVCDFQSGGDDIDLEDVAVPLSQIATWMGPKITPEYVMSNLRLGVRLALLPLKVSLQLYNGPVEECYIKMVRCSSVGPQLLLGHSATCMFDRVVYIGMVETMRLI